MKVKVEEIKKARKIFKDAFAEDEDFRYGYQANIAMYIYDHSKLNRDDCNAIADGIIALIFEDRRK